jgi:hypothetical protein
MGSFRNKVNVTSSPRRILFPLKNVPTERRRRGSQKIAVLAIFISVREFFSRFLVNKKAATGFSFAA